MLTPNEKKTLNLVKAAGEAGFMPALVGRGARQQQAAIARLQAYGYVEPDTTPAPSTRYTITAMGSWSC